MLLDLVGHRFNPDIVTFSQCDTQFQGGRLKVEIQGDNILLGKPMPFTKENIDQFDF